MDNKSKDWINVATYIFVGVFLFAVGIVVTVCTLLANMDKVKKYHSLSKTDIRLFPRNRWGYERQ
jgi:hypothetical protein